MLHCNHGNHGNYGNHGNHGNQNAPTFIRLYTFLGLKTSSTTLAAFFLMQNWLLGLWRLGRWPIFPQKKQIIVKGRSLLGPGWGPGLVRSMRRHVKYCNTSAKGAFATVGSLSELLHLMSFIWEKWFCIEVSGVTSYFSTTWVPQVLFASVVSCTRNPKLGK